MTTPPEITFAETDLDQIAAAPGRVVVFIGADARLDAGARRVNKLTRGGIMRLVAGEKFAKAKDGDVLSVTYPMGMAADAVDVVRLEKRCSVEDARAAGAALAKLQGEQAVLILSGNHKHAAEIAFGFALRAYEFGPHKSEEPKTRGPVTMMASKPEELAAKAGPMAAVAEGVFFTRDLVNEPANILTTDDFAARLAAMQELGLEVEILEEAELAELGMNLLLSVGQGSASPSKVVVMRWNGGAADAAPLALVGKGVVFDTGGISLKPAAGMEDMTMDMGGAGVVSGVMRALALRKAKVNVVGLVGLVENMPSSTATRPGDVVKSMKGDTVEIINTDAEGRLVLADVLWYAQERFEPTGVINLATLTGAIIIGLGHENAGVFSNDDAFCDAFLSAAKGEAEGAWRMPLSPAYDKQLKSRVADMKNVGGRPAGSITAGQFLQRFIKDGTPWIHLDIAGVASVKSDTTLAPAGATGWGVRALNRLIADKYEG